MNVHVIKLKEPAMAKPTVIKIRRITLFILPKLDHFPVYVSVFVTTKYNFLVCFLALIESR